MPSIFKRLLRTLGHAPSRAFVVDRIPDPEPWRLALGDEGLETATEVLAHVCVAFLLRSDDAFRLRPTDRLADVYRAAYPKGGADTLEFETLAVTLERVYGLSRAVTDGLGDRTLAEIVSSCGRSRHPVTA